MDLNGLLIFARVAEAESFTKAAKTLAMPVSTVSRRIAELEKELGVRLLERSTRRLRTTEVGAAIYESAAKTLEIADAVDSIARDRAADVKGRISLSAPPSIAENVLIPVIQAFQRAYPSVRIVDHIGEGIDLAFRVGDLKDSGLIVKKVLRYRHQLVASPAYLKDNKPPRHPSDLKDHRLLTFSLRGRVASWAFTRGDQEETVVIEPALAMNDYTGIAAALLDGAGIADLPPIVDPRLLKEGRLVELMTEWPLRPMDLTMVYLGGGLLPRAVSVFKDFAADMIPTLFDELPT